MKISQHIISNGYGKLKPDYLVIHETASKNADCKNLLNYWSNNPKYCVHYVADWDDIIYNCIPEDRIAYHCGNGNNKSFGIELCHAVNKYEFEKVWNNGIDFSVWVLKTHGWDISRLISHDDARRMWGGTTHTDPIGYFKEFGRSWEEFKIEVQNKLVEKESSEDMELLIKVKEENRWFWLIADRMIELKNNNEIKSVQRYYKFKSGKDISIAEESKQSPWYIYYMQALNR